MSYLEFVEDDWPSRRTTKTWFVKSKRHGYVLGKILWRGGWRQYVFEPDALTVWSTGCLAEIGTFIEARMRERMLARVEAARRLVHAIAQEAEAEQTARAFNV